MITLVIRSVIAFERVREHTILWVKLSSLVCLLVDGVSLESFVVPASQNAVAIVASL